MDTEWQIFERQHMLSCDNKRFLIFVVLYWFILCGTANISPFLFHQKNNNKKTKDSKQMFVWNSNNAIFGQCLEIFKQKRSSTERRPVCSITFSEMTAKQHWHLIPLPTISTGIYLAVAAICLYILTRHFQQVNVSVRLPSVGG